MTVRVQGKVITGYAESHEDPQTVSEGVLVLLRRLPAFRKRSKINLTEDGRPEQSEALAQAVQGKVIVRIVDLVAKARLQT